MAAANTDKLLKVARKWTGTIGAGGVADASVTTIPLSSTTNLPTDTAVVFTIDRVDANGAKTPAKEEVGLGVVNGSNLEDCLRGVEGTAQAHSAGAVVEILYTAYGHNRLIDALLEQHNQDGTHKDALVTTLKSTGAEINTGTEDAKIVTPKAIADSGIAKAKASGVEIGTGTDDAKFATAKAIADSNLGFLTKSPSGCRAYRSSNQTINNNSETVMQFNTETYDLGGEWDNATNYRFTATNAGVYLVRVGATFEAATNNTILAIRVNGTAKAKATKNMAAAYEIAECTAIVNLTAGQYIDATVVQNNGSPAVLHENGESQIMIQRIG